MTPDAQRQELTPEENRVIEDGMPEEQAAQAGSSQADDGPPVDVVSE